MAANTSPIFALTPNISYANPSAANTASDGSGTIGTNIYLLLTAGAAGDYVTDILIMPFASSASTATNATVIRIYLSTQSSGSTTSSNTHLIAEIAIPAVTADQATSAVQFYKLSLERAINANSTILVSTHSVAAGSTGWMVTAFSGSY